MLAYYSTTANVCQAFFEKIFDYFDLATPFLLFSRVFATFYPQIKVMSALFSIISSGSKNKNGIGCTNCFSTFCRKQKMRDRIDNNPAPLIMLRSARIKPLRKPSWPLQPSKILRCLHPLPDRLPIRTRVRHQQKP